MSVFSHVNSVFVRSCFKKMLPLKSAALDKKYLLLLRSPWVIRVDLGQVQLCVRRRKQQPTPVFLPRESRGQRSLVGCCLWHRTESDTTEMTSHACMHWKRKWQPRQCSCLENPRDGGASWAAVSGVAQSRTQLRQLSSSSRRRVSASVADQLGIDWPRMAPLRGLLVR